MNDKNTFGQAYSQASDAFGQFVPGFDFLQGLVKNAGKALPSMGQWVAPTLDPAELERRIEELKTVQFWLEQNARMLGATIQALEVQRMTLGALKGMNVSMGELSEALKVRVPDIFPAPASASAAAAPWPASAAKPAAQPAPDPAPEPDLPSDDRPATPAAGAVDPMQWWGALTQQFTQLAGQALQATQDAAAQAAQASEAVQAATQAATSAAAAAAAEAAKPMADAMQQAAQAATAPVRKAAAQAAAGSASARKASAEKATAPKAAARKASAEQPTATPARKPSAPRRAAAADTPARAPRRKTST